MKPTVKKFYFQPQNFQDFVNTVQTFVNAEIEFDENHPLDLYEIISKWKYDHKLNIIAHINQSTHKVSFTTEWGYPKGDRITQDQLNILTRYTENKESLTKFSYKTEIPHKAQETLFKSLARTLGFTEMKDERDTNKRTYANISVDEVYEGMKRTYRFSSDDYLFSRSDTYSKVTFEHFTNIVWAINKLGIDSELKPFRTKTVY